MQDLAFRVPARPFPGQVVIAHEFGSFRGGKGYNQAVALARLGAQVTMVGAVGYDAHGDGFLDALSREGVDAERVVQVRGTTTGIAVPLITPDGDVAFVQHPGANGLLAPAHCADLPDCDVLLLQGEVPAPTSLRAATVIADRGALVVLNPAPVHEMTPELLSAAGLLVPNEVEARALTADRDGDGIGLAQRLADGGRRAVVTLGAQGAAWADADGGHHMAAPVVTAVDATSAGDSFCAALALRLAEGADLAAAVRFACAAGGHAATVAGAEPSLPTRAQVDTLLATMP